MIRDASDNRRSLDDVMGELYRTTYKAGKGFDSLDWWSAVGRAAGGKSLRSDQDKRFAEFDAKYVDGREPYPWSELLPLAGLRLTADTIQQARVGVSTAPSPDSAGIRVIEVVPGSMAEEAGIRAGDILLSLGEEQIKEQDFGPAYRARYNSHEGEEIPIVVRRGTESVTLHGKVRLVPQVQQKLELDPTAGEKAVRIRSGILHGVRN
jgi:predicted metalloprotease with PDZ domain